MCAGARVGGQPHDHAARVGAPVRGEQPGEGRYEVHAAVVLDSARELLDVGGRADQPELVAQPLHGGARDRDRALEHVGGWPVADLRGDARQQLRGAHDLRAGVDEQEGAGAVGALGLAALEARLAEQRRLLVPEEARHGHAVERGAGARLPEELAGGADLREQRARDAHQPQARLVPVERAQVHQHRAAGVGHVGDVHAARGSAGEVPQQPRVDRPERQLTALGALARARHVLQDPRELRPGEVRRQRQPDVLAQAIGPVLAGELAHERGGARVLPDDRVADRLARAPVPHDARLALVGDADRGDVRGPRTRARERGVDHFPRAPPHLARVVLDPAGVGMDLLVLAALERPDLPVAIEQDQPRAGRALVDRGDVGGHRLRTLRLRTGRVHGRRRPRPGTRARSGRA